MGLFQSSFSLNIFVDYSFSKAFLHQDELSHDQLLEGFLYLPVV